MRQDNEGEFYQQRALASIRWALFSAALSVAMVLFTAWAALGKEQDPYSQLGFVTPRAVESVPKGFQIERPGPRGIMKDIPAIKRALEADVRRVEA